MIITPGPDRTDWHFADSGVVSRQAGPGGLIMILVSHPSLNHETVVISGFLKSTMESRQLVSIAKEGIGNLRPRARACPP
eukprot:2914515-Rhodomonas_salina.1